MEQVQQQEICYALITLFWKKQRILRILEPITVFEVWAVLKFTEPLCHSCKQEGKSKLYKIDKMKVNILRDTLLTFYFDGAEGYIKNKLEEICLQEKVSVEEVIHFFVY